jgi:Family of unknown function (DUF6629)
MCFSATASFTASLVLIPMGTYCVSLVRREKRPYILFALIPLLFGLQQFFEGFVWLGSLSTDSYRYSALTYLFFSHFVWLIWIPLSCYNVERDIFKKNIFSTLVFVGASLGLLMYVPILVNEDWMHAQTYNYSIKYNLRFVSDSYLPQKYLTVIYALVVVAPLLVASDRYLKILGAIVLFSFIISIIAFQYTFISVWCYFSAVSSTYILFMLIRKKEIQAIRPYWFSR